MRVCVLSYYHIGIDDAL